MDPAGTNNANFHDSYGTGNGGYRIGSPYYRTPVGAFASSSSAYGSFDQGENVWEWNETKVFGSLRGWRGGSFVNSSGDLAASPPNVIPNPTLESVAIGFRVAFVPEPGGITLLVAGAVALLLWSLRRHA